MFSVFTKIGLISFCIIASSSPGYGQFNNNYTPLKTYNALTGKPIIEVLRVQQQEELKRLPVSARREAGMIYRARTAYLTELIRKGGVIHDDSLHTVLQHIMNRITTGNQLQRKPNLLLILKDPSVNAYCYGEGTFAVTVGLLSKIKTPDELAFTLAHELAHYELDHVMKRVLKQVESDYFKNTQAGLAKIFLEDITLEDVNKLRKLVYEGSRYSRAHELEADSLGLKLLLKAGFNRSGALGALNVLDSADRMKYVFNERLFEPFYTSKYPFQEAWLNKRLSIYSKRPENLFIFSMDSIQTHPDIEYRMKALSSDTDTVSETIQSLLPYQAINRLIKQSEFERVVSAYFNKQADLTLGLALELMQFYPNNSYLISIISRTFIELIESKGQPVPSIYLPTYTINYDEQLKLVNNFLHNMNTQEMGEVAFNFLNNQQRFNADNEEQYYLLWKICGLTYRNQVQKRIKDVYKARFSDGRYYSLMREGLTLSQALSILSMPIKQN
ncbi:MAG: M48 family metalloprotease [Flammeovirgaceae bacterium]|nr:MAG: M48 family metalloprotease [Flammeovirgaceae bacterium]